MTTKKEQQLNILIAKRDQYFSRIQRLYDSSRDILTEDKLNEFSIRVRTLDTTKSIFLDTVDEINALKCQIDANFEPDYQILESFDELICHIQSVAEMVTMDTKNPMTPQINRISNRRSTPRMPELTLPKFSGDIKEWPLFIECFNSMIHNNLSLTDIDRVHYLIGCLSGSAISVCSGIPPTGDNYKIILKALTDKFEDQRILANSYIKELLKFKQSQVETYSSLNFFLEKFHPTVTALLQLNIADLADYFLAYLAFGKLSLDTQRLFENTRRKSSMPSYEEIINFVKEQAKICSRTDSTNKGNSYSSYKINSTIGNHKPKVSHSFLIQGNNKSICVICKSDSHSIVGCSKFLEVSPEERYKFAKTHNLCLNCLSTHKIINCKSNYTCKICRLKHHTLLHFKSTHNFSNSGSKYDSKVAVGSSEQNSNSSINNFVIPAIASTSTNLNNSNIASSSHSNEVNRPLVNCCSISGNSQFSLHSTVLLSTAIVHIFDDFGVKHDVCFLIDSCSQANFLTLDCCRRLKLNLSKFHSTISGIGSACSTAHGCATVTIRSRFDTTKHYPMEVLIVDKITDQLPHAEVDRNALPHLENLPLADSDFSRPHRIDGIIGAELFPHLLGQKRIIGSPNTPIAIETTLGFIVMGSTPILSNSIGTTSFCTIVEPSLENLVKRFWEVEDITSTEIVDPDDFECERIFQSTYSRDSSSGRYTVTLPFKFNSSLLGNSYSIALQRFLSLEKRLQNSPNLRKQYEEIIRDYVEQGHMAKVSKGPCPSSAYYIPHHAVFKTDSPSTPVRIVFDASCQSDTHYSLNDLLFTGSKLQTDVCTMFLKFRLFKVAFTADIRQMYRQINLSTDHRRYQRLLWRFSPNESIDTYELNTVSFGVKTSPFLALRTVHQLAEDERSSLPLASAVVEKDMYVDDLVSSLASVDQAIELYHQLIELFKRGGFQLVKWATNSKQLFEEIPTNNRTTKVVNFETDFLKILGLQWHPNSDVLFFSFEFVDNKCTKRNILSTIARCYDPLGFLAPVTLLAKLLIKQLWILKLDWDETPPSDLVHTWGQFKVGLPLLSNFQSPRHIGTEPNQSVFIVGFADACLTSFGAVVYLGSTLDSGEVQVHLICAKSKVSPMKVVSIPRLELCAAHLLAKLLHFIVGFYQSRLNITNIYALSDSTVTLNWIATNASKLQIFVANRVSQIQSLTESGWWFHVNGKNNISDCLSRGLTPSQFLEKSEWRNGPDWLKLDRLQWPISPVTLEENLPEIKTISLVTTYVENNPFVTLMIRLSKWTKLVRSMIYVLRFVKLLPICESISVLDLEKAEFVLIKTVQHVHFKSEIVLLKKGICPSTLRHLRPFLKDDIIRVGGRLVNSQLDFNAQHPILLPKRDRLTDLLIDHYHQTNFHTGPNLVLSLLRLHYWILSARSVVRYRIRRCNICFRLKPKPQIPLMGNLPSYRVQQAKPFINSGCDYAGPIQIVPYRKRGIRSVKAYICLFVCLATKALHIELVTDLSTANFLQAFKRFISRRGVVTTIYSDNGTNFIGAKTILQELYKLIASSEYNQTMTNELANRGIEWKLIPPAAPHFGGLWESNVKSVKTHIHKIVGNQLLTYEEFNTLLIQIEALLNSRPLCVLSSDPSDPIALTPAHFLTLTPLSSIPASDLTETNINRLDRFQLIDRMVQDFWKRWHSEYLTSLQTRQRWNTESYPVKIGTIVILEQPNIPPLQWPIGIIEQVYIGKDNVIRVVDVRTKYGKYKRPAIKVCPLPTQ